MSNKNSSGLEPRKRGAAPRNIVLHRVVQLESMPRCKHLPIDSGATLIESIVHLPDKIQDGGKIVESIKSKLSLHPSVKTWL